MDYFIKINDNNEPEGHPFSKKNLNSNFNTLNFDAGVPSGWMKFERVEKPNLGPSTENPYKKFGTPECEYKVIDGVVKDVWNVIDVTDAEKTALQDQEKALWASLPTEAAPPSWVFDETTCRYKAPVDLPSDTATKENPEGKVYVWNESTTSWDEVTD